MSPSLLCCCARCALQDDSYEDRLRRLAAKYRIPPQVRPPCPPCLLLLGRIRSKTGADLPASLHVLSRIFGLRIFGTALPGLPASLCFLLSQQGFWGGRPGLLPCAL